MKKIPKITKENLYNMTQLIIITVPIILVPVVLTEVYLHVGGDTGELWILLMCAYVIGMSIPVIVIERDKKHEKNQNKGITNV